MATTPDSGKPNDEQILVGITESLSKIKINTSSSYNLVDTPTAITNMLDDLEDLPTQPPSIYVDIEGERLSRNGTVSILQIYVSPIKRTYLVDVFTLSNKSFTTSGKNGRTLQAILEDPRIIKVFFDVRNDSDALFAHYQIRLKGIQDLQLMELATRSFTRRHVNGLSKCIVRDGCLTSAEMHQWIRCKEKGRRLFAPECGGRYSVFNDRPLSDEIKSYCVQDVHFLQRLWHHYDGKLTSTWRHRVAKASEDRIAESQSKHYQPHGQHKALAPLSWEKIRY